ncbi:MAG: hypothetical protein ACM3MG_11200 [Bacillota bacterium]
MKNILFSILILAFTAGCGEQNPHLKTLELNREGNKQLKAQNFQAAADKYIEALRFNPFLPELHSNLGLTFEAQQVAEKAQQSYAEAGRLADLSKDPQMQFVSRFNQAQLLGKAKKVDEAIALYQKALDVIPSSKEAKTNIELLVQQQQGGGGKGQDKKDQQQGGQGNQQQQNKDQKDSKDNKDDQNKNKDQDQKDGEKKDKQYQSSPKYKPRPFAGKELSEGDVKKILGEIKQQEGKIRADYNRKEVKEQPRDKDW